IQASQAANTNYLAATAQQTISVAAIIPNLTITSTNAGQAGSFINLSSSSNSNAAVSWSVISGNGSISGSTLYLLGAGNVVIQASQAANTNYLAATAQQTISISAQSIPVLAFSNVQKTYGDGPFTVSASSNSPGTITYSIVSGNSLATIDPNSGLVSILGAGEVILQASQASSGTFAMATATASLSIYKAVRTLTITSDALGQAGNQLSLAAIANPTASIDWTVTSGTGTASISGNSLALLSAGTVTVYASIPEDNNYLAASASQVVTIQAVVTGISSEFKNQGAFISVYPNPFEQEAKLQLDISSDALVSIQVLNLMGVPVVSISENENMKSGSHSFVIESLPAATYLVKAVVNDKVYLLRLVRQ
ncbi:MAG: T9SS type A sorting domain-containing protein, partial [Cytophagales bacterium]|nr:T9SS type A sorting domain-containing protein [Cytophagales bacterium]